MQAEYILKSVVNFARVIIKADKSPEDSVKDGWALFVNGTDIPAELLGVRDPNVRVQVEIRPEEGKIPLKTLVPVSSGNPDIRWRDTLARLFELLGFDDDKQQDQTGLVSDGIGAKRLVSILIDYMKSDDETYDPGDFPRGLKGDLPKDLFPGTRLTRIAELDMIPGFTASRIRRLIPYVTVLGDGRVNVNLAPTMVLKALDENITDDAVLSIVAFREGEDGPFTFQNQAEKLRDILGDQIYDRISSRVTSDSKWYQVIAKVDYGTTSYYGRAYIQKASPGELPLIRSLELF